MKPARIENEELLATVRGLPCIACGRHPPVDAHHVRTRAAGGHDEAENLMPLCREHHTHIHRIGIRQMAEHFPSVFTWLNLAGWRFDGRRWTRYS